MSPLLRILLVDDDETTNFLNQRVLRRLEVAPQLVAGGNGAEALDYLTSLAKASEDSSPTLILLDLQMPVLDGWTFLEAYRRLPFAQRQAPVAIVVLTVTEPSVADLERLQHLPIAAVLYKPLTQEKAEQLLSLFPLPCFATP
ncbi:MAG: response regulator [Janthinobacterium lividum]